MKDLLTFIVAQAGVIAILGGLGMGYMGIVLWGTPIFAGMLTLFGAMMHHHYGKDD